MYSQTSYNETPTGCRLSCVCPRAKEYFQNGRQILPLIVNFTSQSTLLWSENTQLKNKNNLDVMWIYTNIPWNNIIWSRATEYFQNGRQIHPYILNFISQSTLL